MSIVARWSLFFVAAWLTACAVEPTATIFLDAEVGTGLVSAGPRKWQPQVEQPALLPAPLRIAALRAMQSASGFDFREEGAFLTSRVGTNGDIAQVVLDGEAVWVNPDDGRFTLNLRTIHVGRQDDVLRAPHLRTHHAEGQEAVLSRDGVEERYIAGPLGLEQMYQIEA